MTPPTLEEWRRWSACHSRNYTDGPIKKHLLTGTGPDGGGPPGSPGSIDNITRLIEGNENAA